MNDSTRMDLDRVVGLLIEGEWYEVFDGPSWWDEETISFVCRTDLFSLGVLRNLTLTVPVSSISAWASA